MALRSVVKISLTQEAKRAIEEIAAKNKHTEQFVASQCLEWFAAQNDVVQKAILGTLPVGVEMDVAKLVLERIAKGKK